MKCSLKKRRTLIDKLYDQSDDVVKMLEEECEKRPDNAADYRYKIIVATILPLLFARLRDCFFLLSAILGVLFTLALKFG